MVSVKHLTHDQLCDTLERTCNELGLRRNRGGPNQAIFSDALAKKIMQCLLQHTMHLDVRCLLEHQKHLDVVGVQFLNFNVDPVRGAEVNVWSGWLRRNDVTEFVFEMIDALEEYTNPGGHWFVDHWLGGLDFDFNALPGLLRNFIKCSGEAMLFNDLDMARKWFKRFDYRIPHRLFHGEQAKKWLKDRDERDGTDWVDAVQERLHKVLNHNHIPEAYGFGGDDPEYAEDDFNNDVYNAQTVLVGDEAGKIAMHVRGIFTINRGEEALDAIPPLPYLLSQPGRCPDRDDPLGR